MAIIASNAFGIFLLSETGDLLGQFSYGDLNKQSFLDAIKDQEKIIVDNTHVASSIRENVKVQVDLNNPVLKEWRLDRYSNLLEKTGVTIDHLQYIEKVKAFAVQRSRETVRKHAEGRDTLIAQAIHAIDEIQKSFVLLSGRLKEIYSLHFPELTNRVRNPATLAKLILMKPERTEITLDLLTSLGIDEEHAKYIISYKNESLGGSFKKEDLIIIQSLADSVHNLYKRKQELEDWVTNTMNEVAPNLAAVAGTNVGARLIAHVGNLRDLAFLSSGKVQTLGAEKALYKALRFNGKTPKHGIIFQIPEVGTMPFWLRGKMARAFASKIVIAARLDLYGGSFLGDQLREQLKEKSKKLREQFPNPPKPKETKGTSKSRKKFRKNRKRRKK